MEPDSELHILLSRYQNGDAGAGWKFIESVKIKAIIMGRLQRYRMMFAWLPYEDMEDVESSLRPRLLEIAKKFQLSEQRNDGRIISYFAQRIKGEADSLLKKITGMKQVIDADTKATYYKTISQPLETLGDVSSEVSIDDAIINSIEDERRSKLLEQYFASIPPLSNDRLWCKCYLHRLSGKTWDQISTIVGYKQGDYTFLRDNTLRFVTRLKDHLLRMNEDISYTVCGIYSDDSEVSICVYDSTNHKRCVFWEKWYHDYEDLMKIEGKLGDIFRENEITYVVMNEEPRESRATVIMMRSLTKREAFVEFLRIEPFIALEASIPNSFGGAQISKFKKRAYLLTQIKRATIEVSREQRKNPSGPGEDCIFLGVDC